MELQTHNVRSALLVKHDIILVMHQTSMFFVLVIKDISGLLLVLFLQQHQQQVCLLLQLLLRLLLRLLQNQQLQRLQLLLQRTCIPTTVLS
jgi:hypothetical protein